MIATIHQWLIPLADVPETMAKFLPKTKVSSTV
jgi:hypothetical protein